MTEARAVNVSGSYVLESLSPLVGAGYKRLAARAAEEVERWHSSLSLEAISIMNGKLALLNPPASIHAPKLYVATGGVIQQRTLSGSGSLLEDDISAAVKELSALGDAGNVAAISPKSFDRLFFALDYGVFQRQPTVNQSLEIAMAIAVSNYKAVGGGEFVKQLEVAGRFGGVKVSEQLQGVDYTEDGRLALLVFKLTPKVPSVLNIVTSLRLLYIAANAVLPQQQNYQDLGQRIAAAATAQGIFPDAFSPFLAENSNLQIIAEQLGKVSLHKGVEALINGCEQLPPLLKAVLGLTKALDTVRTGRVALDDSDKPYSDAIGLAELVG